MTLEEGKWRDGHMLLVDRFPIKSFFMTAEMGEESSRKLPLLYCGVHAADAEPDIGTS